MEKRVSPPKAIVDSSPLLINKNRECEFYSDETYAMPSNDECVNTKINQFSFFIAALKVKLLVRRSANQLVEQNILPRNEQKFNYLLT